MNIAISSQLSISNDPSFMGWLRAQILKSNRRPAHITGARRTVHEIAKCETVTVMQPQGSIIECLNGSIWVTLDNDLRDVILEAGQSFLADSDQRLLVHALDESRVRILETT